MIRLTFEAPDRDGLRVAIEQWLAGEVRRPPTPTLEAPRIDSARVAPDQLEIARALLSRIRTQVARGFVKEVAETALDGRFVAFDRELLRRHGAKNPQAWGGLISPINRAAHLVLGGNRNLVTWDPVRDGYSMDKGMAAAVVALLD